MLRRDARRAAAFLRDQAQRLLAPLKPKSGLNGPLGDNLADKDRAAVYVENFSADEAC